MQREHYTYGPQGELLAVSNAFGYAFMDVVYLEGKPLVAFMPPNPGLGLYASMSDKILNPGDKIYIDGFGSGGVSNEYEYRISVKDVSANTTSVIKDWSADNYATWTVPDAVGKGFSFTVAVRNKGGTATRTATLIRDTSSFSSIFTVQAPLSISSTLSRSQAQPGQSITLSAQVSGGISGEAYEYSFLTAVGGKSIVLSEGSATSATYTIPADATATSQIFTVRVKQASAPAWSVNTHKLTITTPATNTPAVINGVRKQYGGYSERYVVNSNVATQPFYVHTDHLGTPRALTDTSGKMVWSWHSEPFGETPANDDPDQDGKKVTFNLRFPGQYFDVETGLFYNYFRDYDALTGRYVQSDPIGLEGGINTYAYVGGNPVTGADPFGLATCILVTRSSSGFGTHAALYLTRGDNGGPALYDPSGSYARSIDPHSGDMMTGNDASPNKFSEFQKKLDGSETDSTCQLTTEKEERDFYLKAVELGEGFGPVCAAKVSTVIGGSNAFPNVSPGTRFPGNLFRGASK